MDHGRDYKHSCPTGVLLPEAPVKFAACLYNWPLRHHGTHALFERPATLLAGFLRVASVLPATRTLLDFGHAGTFSRRTFVKGTDRRLYVPCRYRLRHRGLQPIGFKKWGELASM